MRTELTSVLSCPQTAFSRFPVTNRVLADSTTGFKMKTEPEAGRSAGTAGVWSCSRIVTGAECASHQLSACHACSWSLLLCPRQRGSPVDRRLPSAHPWLASRFQLHHNLSHLLLHFVLDSCFFLFLPGSQGKPSTQIPQCRSAAQRSAADYAQVSQLLRPIPVLICSGSKHFFVVAGERAHPPAVTW